MGQKIHPTGFRIGINQPYQSTWFANYGVYSKVLQEDYKIRQFFEKEWDTVYSKAGIAKLEIKRKDLVGAQLALTPEEVKQAQAYVQFLLAEAQENTLNMLRQQAPIRELVNKQNNLLVAVLAPEEV